MAKTGRLPMGTVPKGKGGSRALDHKSVGKPATGSNQKLADTSHAGGKPHKSMGGGENQKYNSPKVKTYAQGPQGKQGGGY